MANPEQRNEYKASLAQALINQLNPALTMAASSAHVYSWDDMAAPLGGDPGGEGDEPSPDEPQTPEECGEVLVELLAQLLFEHNISAKSMCLICYWADKVGAKGPLGKYALRPGAPTGHYQRKVDSASGVDLRQDAQEMYKIEVPQHSKYDLSGTPHAMVVRPPHEELTKEVEKDSALLDPLEGEEWAQNYHQHPVVLRNPGRKILPYAFYLDGISFGVRDSLLGLFVYNLRSKTRHLCAILRRSHMCQCGCRGWCSLYPIFEFLRWSFECLAVGSYPGARHDGPWRQGEDDDRQERSGQSLCFVGALLHIKGD